MNMSYYLVYHINKLQNQISSSSAIRVCQLHLLLICNVATTIEDLWSMHNKCLKQPAYYFIVNQIFNKRLQIFQILPRGTKWFMEFVDIMLNKKYSTFLNLRYTLYFEKVVKLRLSVHEFINVIKLVCMPLFIRGTSFIRSFTFKV